MKIHKTILSEFNASDFFEKYQDDREDICKSLTALYNNEPNELRSFLSRIASDLNRNYNYDESRVITLCSKSPRRKALLEILIPNKEIRTLDNNDDVELYFRDYTPEQNTLNIALQKMFSYFIKSSDGKCKDHVVITADTVVELPDNTIIGKFDGDHDPLKDKSPIEKLKLIVQAGRNKPIKIHTAYVLYNSREPKLVFDTDTALMRFNALEETLCESELLFVRESAKYSPHLSKLFDLASISYEDILAQYVEEGLHEGKAGGFDIRDRDFFLCVKEIYGDPSTIIGLPCVKLSKQLSGSVRLESIINCIWPSKFEQNKIHI